MKPLLVQLVPVAACLLHVAPREENVSTLFVAALQVLKYCDEVPPRVSFSLGRKKS